MPPVTRQSHQSPITDSRKFIRSHAAADGLTRWPVGSAHVARRDEIILGIPMDPVGPTGFPWEWESIG